MDQSMNQSFTDSLRSRHIQRNWLFIELGGLFLLWYALFGSRWSGYLVPMGNEYARSMHSFYTWDYLMTCGECAWWSNIIGGYPNFAEMFGSFVHPISFINSMIWGAVTGSSMTVAMSYLLIMFAGWWFAYELKVHVIARIWYAIAVMLGGHMMCRLEIGSIGLPLSIAAAWLFIISMISYIHSPSRTRALVVSICAGSLLLAGQGYMQLAIVLSLPLWAWYAYTQNLFERHRFVWRDAAWVTVIALFMAAPIYVSSAFTSGLYWKETELSNKFDMPISKILINLLIDDFDVVRSDIYNNFAFPYAYGTYIGITSFVFAIAGYHWLNDSRYKLLYRTFAILSACAAILASGYPKTWMIELQIQPFSDFAAGVRYIILFNSFVALGILTLAMFGIHGLLTTKMIDWPPFLQRFKIVPIKVIVVVVLLVSNVQSMYQFGSNWLIEVDQYPSTTATFMEDIKELPVGYIMGPDWMVIPFMSHNIKISEMIFSWRFVEFKFPPAAYVLTNEPPSANWEVIKAYDGGWILYRTNDPASVYAQVTPPKGRPTTCQVDYALAGKVDLTCTTDEGGKLVVLEHDMPEWRATVNNQVVQPSVGTGWITLNIPAGTTTIQLRYQPWYIIPSLIVGMLGWSLAIGGIIWLSIKKKATRA